MLLHNLLTGCTSAYILLLVWYRITKDKPSIQRRKVFNKLKKSYNIEEEEKQKLVQGYY